MDRMCPNSYIYNMKKPKPKVKRAIASSKIVQSAEDLKRQGKVLEARAFLEDHISDLKKVGLEREYVNGLSVLSDLRRGTDDSKSAITLLQQSLALAKKHGFQDLVGEITKKRAFLCLLLDDYKQCYQDAQDALRMSRDQGNKPLEIGALAVLGHLHEVRKERPKALVWFRQAMVIATEVNDTWRRAGLYHDLGRIHGELREYLIGLDYLEQGEQYCLKHKYMNRYYMMIRAQGDIYKAIGDLNRARTLYEKSHSDPDKLDNPSEVLENSTRFGDLYIQEGNIDEAMRIFQRGAKIARSLRYKRKILQNYFGIARCYEHKQQFGKAFEQYKSVIREIASDFENNLSTVIAALEMCSFTLAKLGESDLSLRLENLWQGFQKLEDEGTYTAHRRAEMRAELLLRLPEARDSVLNAHIGMYEVGDLSVHPISGKVRYRDANNEIRTSTLSRAELIVFNFLKETLNKSRKVLDIYKEYAPEDLHGDDLEHIADRVYKVIQSMRRKGIPKSLLHHDPKEGGYLLRSE